MMTRITRLTLLLALVCSATIGLAEEEATTPTDDTESNITVFSPGLTNTQALTDIHKDLEKPDKVSDCEQCHRGQEGDMGLKLAERGQAASRDIKIAFTANEDQLQIQLTWQGPTDDQGIAFMWGNNGNQAFKHDGCWASCHSDMRGIATDENAQQGKYLQIARAQPQPKEGAPKWQTDTALAQMFSQGNYIEIWQANIISATEATFRGGTILEQLTWQEHSEVKGQIAYSKGRWSVTFTRPLRGGPGHAKTFLPDALYTFGVALSGAKLPAVAHWVSLPRTFSIDNKEADFIALKETKETEQPAEQ